MDSESQLTFSPDKLASPHLELERKKYPKPVELFIQFLSEPSRNTHRWDESAGIPPGPLEDIDTPEEQRKSNYHLVEGKLTEVNEKGIENTKLREFDHARIERIKQTVSKMQLLLPWQHDLGPLRSKIVDIWKASFSKVDIDQIAEKYIPYKIIDLVNQRIERLYRISEDRDEGDEALSKLLLTYNINSLNSYEAVIFSLFIKAALYEHYLIAEAIPATIFQEYDRLCDELEKNITVDGMERPPHLSSLRTIDWMKVKFVDIRRLEGSNATSSLAIGVDPDYTETPFLGGETGSAQIILHERSHEIMRENSQQNPKALKLEDTPTYNEVFAAACGEFAFKTDLSDIPQERRNDYSNGLIRLHKLLQRIDKAIKTPNYSLEQLIWSIFEKPVDETKSIYERLRSLYDSLCAETYGRSFDQEMLLYSDVAMDANWKDSETRKQFYKIRKISQQDQAIYEEFAKKDRLAVAGPREWYYDLLFAALDTQ